MPGAIAEAVVVFTLTVAVPSAIIYGFYQSNPWIKAAAGVASGAIGLWLIIVSNLRIMR